MKKRTAALVLALLMLLPSCSTAGPKETTDLPGETDDSIKNDVVEEAETNARESVADTVPELDYGDSDFTILTRSEDPYCDEFIADEDLLADPLEEALYNRQIYTEDRLKVNIDIEQMEGLWGAHTTFVSNVSNSIMANDGAYDMIACYSYTAPMIAIRGVLSDLNEVENLNLDKPWWHKGYEEAATVNGRLYTHAGDIVTTATDERFAIFFNKDLLTQYHPEANPYDMVLEGKWTVDALGALSNGLYNDLNFDGKRGPEDFYGASLVGMSTDAYYIGCGGTFTKTDDEGNIVWDFFTERNNNIIDNWLEYLEQNGISTALLFLEERTIFEGSTLNMSKSLREFDSDYGILPFPKWDEEQPEYHSMASDGFSVIMIPKDVKDVGRAGAVVEVMAADSYRHVTPAYFENNMKGKYFRDEMSAKMFDLIIESATYDFAIINSSALNDPVFVLRNSMNRVFGKFAATYAGNQASLKRNLAKVLEDFAAFE